MPSGPRRTVVERRRGVAQRGHEDERFALLKNMLEIINTRLQVLEVVLYGRRRRLLLEPPPSPTSARTRSRRASSSAFSRSKSITR